MSNNRNGFRRPFSRLCRVALAPCRHLSRGWRRALYRLRLAKAYASDCCRYAQYGQSSEGVLNRTQMQALLTMRYHVLEKGLSMKDPRPGFGQEAAAKLLATAEEYVRRFGGDRGVAVAAGVLAAYYDFNRACGAEPFALRAGIERLQNLSPEETGGGGSRPQEKQDIWARARIDFRNFAASRFSIRHFAPGEVADELIAQAVDMARKTPSACNRQSWKAYVYSAPESKKKLLELQHGHRGFAEQISKLMILTADLQAYAEMRERHQAWIDGGMFAMSVVYALHSLGLGTCCLNLCLNPQADRLMKAAGGIPDSEVLLMMVAVGHLPDSFRVAASVRKPLAEILVPRP